MTSANPTPAAWQSFTSLVEDLQQRSELDNAFLKDVAEIRRSYEARAQFHNALNNRSVSLEQLTALAEPASERIFMLPPTSTQLSQLRQDLERHPIRFTSVEPPITAVLLARSYARMSKAFFLKRDCEYLFATDLRYRPHASVQQWAEGKYLMLMGRYLIVDIFTMANIVARHVIEAGSRFGDAPWSHPDFPAVLSAGSGDQLLHHQLAYYLSATVEGERYRVAVVYELDPNVDAITAEIANGALDFLMGHELSHVARGHLSIPRPESDAGPWYAVGTYKRILAGELGVGRDVIDTYLSKYWSVHSLESQADMYAILLAAGWGEGSAWDLRLMGCQLAVALISFLDRAHYMVETGRDPAMSFGLKNYGVPGLIDLLIPRTSHPWGKTRALALTASVPLIYQEWLSQEELRRKVSLMVAVGDILGRAGAYSLEVVRWANKRPGEYMVLVGPDDKLVTFYFPPDFVADRDKPQEINSAASKFYMDVEPGGGTRHVIEEHYEDPGGPGTLSWFI